MEHNRKTKMITIVVLIVIAFGLSIGFAVYSRNLNIQNVQATVTGNEANFDVLFTPSYVAPPEYAGSGKISGGGSGGTGGQATISGTTISNLTVTFTGQGEITYGFGVYNKGKIKAYLKSVTIPKPTCTPKNGASQELVNAACDDISVTVRVGSNSYSATNNSINDTEGMDTNKGKEVTVTITNTGAHAVDGDFTATIDNITLNYSTQPGTGA